MVKEKLLCLGSKMSLQNEKSRQSRAQKMVQDVLENYNHLNQVTKSDIIWEDHEIQVNSFVHSTKVTSNNRTLQNKIWKLLFA